jgi:hypothetical protein
MGFGLRRLQDAAVDNAKQGIVEAKSLENASEDAESPHQETPASVSAPMAAAPVARANVFAGGARPSFGAPAATSSPTAPGSRPSFGAPTSSSRPSFGSPATAASAPEAPKQDARPSFGSQSPSQASLPNARAVFVRNPGRQSEEQGSAPKSGVQDILNNPQALFEVVCTHRKMSASAIEAARAQAISNPDGVFSQMRRIYDQEIAPARSKHATDLPQAREANPGKIVFLLRKDALERVRIMPFEEAERTGEVLLNGTTVENVQAASSPFSAPSELFAAPAPAVEVEPIQEDLPSTPSRSSPKP